MGIWDAGGNSGTIHAHAAFGSKTGRCDPASRPRSRRVAGWGAPGRCRGARDRRADRSRTHSLRRLGTQGPLHRLLKRKGRSMASRPLSPHLSIYRFAYTMALSIYHRATGILLSVGLFLLVGWLFALAQGAAAHAAFSRFAASWPVRLALVLLLVCFCYHLANGIRHLFWDLGKG